MITNTKRRVIWILWLIVLPAFLYLSGKFWPPGQVRVEWLEILSFAVLLCIISMFPIIINGTPIFFIQALNFVVFLYYGLFVELILTQLAIIALLLKVRVNKHELFRYPLNMLMFLFVSFIGAVVFKVLGGVNGENALAAPENILAVFGYVAAVTVSNQLLLYFVKRIMYHSKEKLVDKGLFWELGTTAVVVPIGFILYLSYIDIGLFAIYFVGVPLISVSFILRLYYHSQQVSLFLKETSKIGNELTRKMEKAGVIDLFIDRLKNFLPADYILVLEVKESDHLQLTRFYDVENKLDFPDKATLKKGESISGTVWERRQGIHFYRKAQWKERKNHLMRTDGESVMSVPVEIDENVVGVITVISKERKAFENYQFMLLEILANYLAVALVNANNYEATLRRHEHDPLTGLYNYRFLETSLNDLSSQKDIPAHFAVIMVDLDHFKKVNDTYGHESGNEVLQEMGSRMKKIAGDKALAFRYGGEEFSILLPGCTLKEAMEKAEMLRRIIADQPFTVRNHILNDDYPWKVDLTASIGVASCPEHADSPRDLIRLADRAMYLGAKKRGRNRVAIYGNTQNEVG